MGVSSCVSEALYDQRATILDIVSRRRVASNDFNDDNLPDIVWHNSSTGETQIWLMDYSSRVGRVTVVDEPSSPMFVGLPWRMVGSRDFDRDHHTDILWYNEATKELQVWIMEDHRIRTRLPIMWDNTNQAFVGWPWAVVGVNDMDGDGYADIIWHHATTGETQLWRMIGNRLSYRRTVHDENLVPMRVGWPWTIVATSDMNQDQRADIVWHNDLSGETQVWYMNNWRILKRQTVLWENFTYGAALVGWPWRITSANDFDDDRIGDLVWHNASTGETQIWFMNVGAIKRRATVDADLDGWTSQFVGDPWRIMPH